jgi:hypothetical protein
MGIMTKQPFHYNDVRLIATRQVAGIPLVRVDATDRYHQRRFAVERHAIRTFLNSIDWFLRQNPALAFESKMNITRHLIYLPPAMRAWRAYVPGGLATYHVHSPHVKRMHHGKKLDAITRAFFRHSVDAIGLRSRAYIMSWLARETIAALPEGRIEWLSLAAGSGQPVYDACRALRPEDRKRLSLILVDSDTAVLDFAKHRYAAERDVARDARFLMCDLLDTAKRTELLRAVAPQIIDIMGLFEYLDDDECREFIAALWQSVSKGGSIIFTNMSPGHPHLQVHQRALGWPGVKQRSAAEVVAILDAANIPKKSQSVYRAQDNVYNVYRVAKP